MSADMITICHLCASGDCVDCINLDDCPAHDNPVCECGCECLSCSTSDLGEVPDGQ